MLKLSPKILGFLISLLLTTGCMTNVRYVAIGDSYTIGEGATPAQAWPQLLANHLTREGLTTELIANPGRTGWTTQQAIDYELPVLQTSDANFVTILLGSNDYVQGVSSETFKARFSFIVDQTINQVGAERVIILTIPDFSVTPVGKQFAKKFGGPAKFNSIIEQIAHERNLPVIDLFTPSQAMGQDPTLVAPDGLHPSAKMYAEWEILMYNVVLDRLN